MYETFKNVNSFGFSAQDWQELPSSDYGSHIDFHLTQKEQGD